MSLSKHLQSPEILSAIPGKQPEQLRALILEKGRTWYHDHPEETALIKNNLLSLDLSVADDFIEEIRTNVILHYYEKFLPLCQAPRSYHDFLSRRVDFQEAIAVLREAREDCGVLLAVAHYGAVELLAPTLAMHLSPINSVLRFTTERFSETAKKHAQRMEATGLFSPFRFIEIGKPGVMAALEMTAALRNKELLISVFDEKTEYSVAVTLLGKRMWGGAGLDRLLKFTNAPVAAFNAFMIRTKDDRYRLELLPIDCKSADPVQSMFSNLEIVLHRSLEQWYFLHEEIPFVL